MSELKRYEAVNPYEQPSESEHGEYYLADDVDKHIEELKQSNKELADNLEEAKELQFLHLLQTLQVNAEWKNEVAPKISELKQRNKDIEQALKMSKCKFDTDNDGNCHLCVGKGCFRERLLKGGE